MADGAKKPQDGEKGPDGKKYEEKRPNKEWELKGARPKTTQKETKEALVTLDDINNKFAVKNEYGNKTPDDWPKETILLYKHNKSDEWKRLGNIPNAHAEVCLFLETYDESFKDVDTVEMILSYSPCPECCTLLIWLARVKQYELKICFSNFYNTHIDVKYLTCLADLLDAEIKLKIFENESDWEHLFEVTQNNAVSNKEKIKRINEDRKERQQADTMMLTSIYTFKNEREILQTKERDLLPTKVSFQKAKKKLGDIVTKAKVRKRSEIQT